MESPNAIVPMMAPATLPILTKDTLVSSRQRQIRCWIATYQSLIFQRLAARQNPTTVKISVANNCCP
jgi:hypothetical protein